MTHPDPDSARLRARILREEAAGVGEPARGLLLARAAFLEQFASELERLRGLTAVPNQRKVRHTMAEVSQAQPPSRTGPGRPRKSQHAFPAALGAKGLTVAEWARERKLERSVVRSWFADKARDQRSIPLREAEEIRRAFGIPFTAWPKGVRD